jgi:phospholipid transport system substrate-binding protein
MNHHSRSTGRKASAWNRACVGGAIAVATAMASADVQAATGAAAKTTSTAAAATKPAAKPTPTVAEAASTAASAGSPTPVATKPAARPTPPSAKPVPGAKATETKPTAAAGATTPPPAGSAAAPAGALATLKRSNEQIQQVLRTNTPGQETKQREQVKQLVNTFLDYDELARRSLARHWDTLSPAQRTEFSQLLRELIERNYVKQVRTSLDYNITYDKEEAQGEEATVKTVVHAKRKGRQADALVAYAMHRVEGRWLVFDVTTDEVSLVRNYRSQFNKIISRDGYQGLVAKMRSKLTSDEG